MKKVFVLALSFALVLGAFATVQAGSDPSIDTSLISRYLDVDSYVYRVQDSVFSTVWGGCKSMYYSSRLTQLFYVYEYGNQSYTVVFLVVKDMDTMPDCFTISWGDGTYTPKSGGYAGGMVFRHLYRATRFWFWTKTNVVKPILY